MRLELGNLALYIGRRMDKIKGRDQHRTVPSDCDLGDALAWEPHFACSSGGEVGGEFSSGTHHQMN